MLQFPYSILLTIDGIYESGMCSAYDKLQQSTLKCGKIREEGDNCMKNEKCESHHHRGGAGAGGCVYGLGFIGSAVYYFQHVTTFSGGVMAVLRAIVWPALLIYKVFGMLHM